MKDFNFSYSKFFAGYIFLYKNRAKATRAFYARLYRFKSL